MYGYKLLKVREFSIDLYLTVWENDGNRGIS